MNRVKLLPKAYDRTRNCLSRAAIRQDVVIVQRNKQELHFVTLA